MKIENNNHNKNVDQVKSSKNIDNNISPYKCPVCNGNGLVPNGFYLQTSGHWSSTDITPEKCRSCQGTGVIWN